MPVGRQAGLLVVVRRLCRFFAGAVYRCAWAYWACYAWLTPHWGGGLFWPYLYCSSGPRRCFVARRLPCARQGAIGLKFIYPDGGAILCAGKYLLASSAQHYGR